MTHERALSFAKEHDGVAADPKGTWRDFDVYVYVFSESSRGGRLGPPIFILCNENMVRFATDEETMAILYERALEYSEE